MGKAHRHIWRETLWSLEGVFRFLIECKVCLKTELVAPNKRKRKVPEGMKPERFEAMKAMVEEPELLEAFRDRVRSASSRQLGDAWQKGILPPVPTLEDLEAYRARTADRLEKREPDLLPSCYLHGTTSMSLREAGHHACDVCHPAPEISDEDRILRRPERSVRNAA